MNEKIISPLTLLLCVRTVNRAGEPHNAGGINNTIATEGISNPSLNILPRLKVLAGVL
jgi:hypothetical protein